MKTTTARKTQRGFTLVELVVVCAVLGLLASLEVSSVGAARSRAERIVCQKNLKELNLGTLMLLADSKDLPALADSTNGSDLDTSFAFKEVIKDYVAVGSWTATPVKKFSCPADVFYFDYCLGKRNPGAPWEGYVPESWSAQSNSAFSSYVLNAKNLSLVGTNSARHQPAGASLRLESIQHPSRTVLVCEAPALFPFSWHEPKEPLYVGKKDNCPNFVFNNAMNMIGFADGRVSYTKIYWNGTHPTNHVLSGAGASDPPAGYDYQWSSK